MTGESIVQIGSIVIATMLAVLSGFTKVRDDNKKITKWGIVTIVLIFLALGVSIFLETKKSADEQKSAKDRETQYRAIIGNSNLAVIQSEESIKSLKDLNDSTKKLIDSLNKELLLQRIINFTANQLLDSNRKISSRTLSLLDATRIIYRITEEKNNPLHPLDVDINFSMPNIGTFNAANLDYAKPFFDSLYLIKKKLEKGAFKSKFIKIQYEESRIVGLEINRIDSLFKDIVMPYLKKGFYLNFTKNRDIGLSPSAGFDSSGMGIMLNTQGSSSNLSSLIVNVNFKTNIVDVHLRFSQLIRYNKSDVTPLVISDLKDCGVFIRPNIDFFYYPYFLKTIVLRVGTGYSRTITLKINETETKPSWHDCKVYFHKITTSEYFDIPVK